MRDKSENYSIPLNLQKTSIRPLSFATNLNKLILITTEPEYNKTNKISVSIVRSGHYRHYSGRSASGPISGPPVALFRQMFDKKTMKKFVFSFHFPFLVMNLCLCISNFYNSSFHYTVSGPLAVR